MFLGFQTPPFRRYFGPKKPTQMTKPQKGIWKTWDDKVVESKTNALLTIIFLEVEVDCFLNGFEP